METKNKIITIRENLIREIDSKNVLLLVTAEATGINSLRLYDYYKGDESILNGAEIQRIFNYLNGLK